MKDCNLLILFVLLSALGGCSMMDYRDYSSEMAYEYSTPMFEANKDFMIVAGDSGKVHASESERRARVPASERDFANSRYDNSLKKELVRLENSLEPHEYENYLEYAHKIGSTSQKIYFLQLTKMERDEYLKIRKIKSDFVRTREIASVERKAQLRRREFPQLNDIMLGMSKNDVVQNWGPASREDIAGDPRLENERWVYQRADSTKYIYFESGRVEGWNER